MEQWEWCSNYLHIERGCGVRIQVVTQCIFNASAESIHNLDMCGHKTQGLNGAVQLVSCYKTNQPAGFQHSMLLCPGVPGLCHLFVLSFQSHWTCLLLSWKDSTEGYSVTIVPWIKSVNQVSRSVHRPMQFMSHVPESTAVGTLCLKELSSPLSQAKICKLAELKRLL